MDLLGRELEMIMNDRAEDEIHFQNLRNQLLKSTDSILKPDVLKPDFLWVYRLYSYSLFQVTSRELH